MMTNNINIVGRLTKDSNNKELRKNKYIVWFDIAFNMYYTKEKGENSGYIKVLAIYKNQDFANKYLKKGKKISVNGKLMYKKYKNKEGNTKNTFYINASNIDIL